jgi:hypothetical protein
MAWYTARNILYQGVPWGAAWGQYRGDDILKAQQHLLAAWSDKNSFAYRHHKENFKERISQEHAIWEEGYLQIPHGEKLAVPNAAWGRVKEFTRGFFGLSDNWNRSYTTLLGDVIIEGYMDKFLQGKISQAQLFHGLKADAMPLSRQRMLLDVFSRARAASVDKFGNEVLIKENFYPFMKHMSEHKTLLANYAYRISERSAAEQDDNFRWLLGIAVYPRGTAEVMNETIVAPLARSFTAWQKSGFKADHLDVDTVKTAFGNLFAQLIGRAVATEILRRTVGEKLGGFGRKHRLAAYELAESLSWSPMGPGATDLFDIAGMFSEIVASVKSGDKKKTNAVLDNSINMLLYYTYVAPFLKPIVEALGDRRSMTHMEVMNSVIKWRIKGGKWNERDALGAFTHALFGTERPPESIAEAVASLAKRLKGRPSRRPGEFRY